MHAQRFDSFARALVSGGSRRRLLTALGGAGLLIRFGVEQAAACVGDKCSGSNPCCDPDHHRCRKGHCRCKKGWKDCDGNQICETNVQADSINCGECGKVCASGKCCLNGNCKLPNCDLQCCPDCFLELEYDGTPSGIKVCCGQNVNWQDVCHKPGTSPAKDSCCAEAQVCVKGECCFDGGEVGGSVVCDGKCCAQSSCCNLDDLGETCCPTGQHCATVDGVETCVDDDRPCVPGVPPLCHFGSEACHASVCCPLDRACTNPIACCPAGTYCDPSSEVKCCPVGYTCSGTNIKQKVRA